MYSIDSNLQIIILISSIFFMAYILAMISRGKVELKYSLIWLVTAFIFILLSVFPQILIKLSNMLHIITPVNALFLVIISLLLVMIFTLTIALSKIKKQITSMCQELGILKSKLEKWKGKD